MKFAPIALSAVFLLAAAPSQALELQTLTPPPGGGPQFADPDENRPFSVRSEGSGQGSGGMATRSGQGLHFSLSGGNQANPAFIPGFTVPQLHGPAIDPQTRDPYPFNR